MNKQVGVHVALFALGSTAGERALADVPWLAMLQDQGMKRLVIKSELVVPVEILMGVGDYYANSLIL